ncbi:MAG: omptin family outer membrane protease [Syntrophotaleaceae bacterium]
MSNLISPARILTSICCFFFILNNPAEGEISASVGGGYLAGDTQYQVGGTVVDATGVYEIHFPLSELKFPLDAFMVKGTVNVDFAKRWSLMASAATNITDDTGNMEDSDWGIFNGSTADTLDVYSESDTDMEALLLEGKISCKVGQFSIDRKNRSDIFFSWFVGLGYKYQKFDFDISNLDQWYPSAPAIPHDIVPGVVLTYEAEYQIPYLDLSLEMNVAQKFLLHLGGAYAPFVDFKDEDHHLLRGLSYYSDHDWEGDAWFVRLKGRYDFHPRWFIVVDAEAMRIESEGRSHAYLAGTWSHTIDNRVESEQYSAYLSIGCDF